MSAQIITVDDIQKLNRETVDKFRASFILKIVDNSLGADATNNYGRIT